MLSTAIRAASLAAATAVIATPAAADVVVFEGSGHASSSILTFYPLTPGVFDLYVETSEFVNFDVEARGLFDLYIKTVAPPQTQVDRGNAGYTQGGKASGYSAFFQFDIPPDSYGQFVAGSQYLHYGIAPGTLMSSELVYYSRRLTVSAGVLPGNGPPYEYDYTVKLVKRTAVPEPATWALMFLGFGGAGCALRRRHLALLTSHQKP